MATRRSSTYLQLDLGETMASCLVMAKSFGFCRGEIITDFFDVKILLELRLPPLVLDGLATAVRNDERRAWRHRADDFPRALKPPNEGVPLGSSIFPPGLAGMDSLGG